MRSQHRREALVRRLARKSRTLKPVDGDTKCPVAEVCSPQQGVQLRHWAHVQSCSSRPVVGQQRGDGCVSTLTGKRGPRKGVGWAFEVHVHEILPAVIRKHPQLCKECFESK